MPLTDYFDVTCCINLDRRPDKWAECVKSFKTHNLTVAHIKGVDGDTLPYPTKQQRGNIGCAMSHAKVIKMAKYFGFKTILIFEDDVAFDDDLNSKFFEWVAEDKTYDVEVIVPVRGRETFLQPLLSSLKRAYGKVEVNIIVVEHSAKSIHSKTSSVNDVDYIWIPCNEQATFNKSLAFNIGYLVGRKAEWIMFHDLDCLVQKDFFAKVNEQINAKNADAIQPFKDRRVVYCNNELTQMLIAIPEAVDGVTSQSNNVFTVKGHAPGGSLMLRKELFEAVGMYDPELFYGYAPEDRFMWNKVSCLTTIYSCDTVDIFHMHHEFLGNSNPAHKHQSPVSVYP